MKRSFHLLAISALVFCFANSVAAQSSPYPSASLPKLYEDLFAKINAIPIYDNHAHPGFADDSDVDAMASPPDESNVLRLRDDEPRPSLSQEEALANAPAAVNGFFRVPSIQEET